MHFKFVTGFMKTGRKREISWSLFKINIFCDLYIIPYEFLNKS